MELDVIVEIPKGSRNKYEMDHTLGRIRLDRTLFTATAYPCEYGYLPETLAEDGDPLDALVLVDQPTFPGCQIHARPVAAFCMHDEHGQDTKILCVPAEDDRKASITELTDLPRHQLAEIGHFFDVYKDLEPGKNTQIEGWQGREAAERAVKESRDRAAH
jgi:inorganic pyrophosphatase